jgi:hypothetical protein
MLAYFVFCNKTSLELEGKKLKISKFEEISTSSSQMFGYAEFITISQQAHRLLPSGRRLWSFTVCLVEEFVRSELSFVGSTHLEFKTPLHSTFMATTIKKRATFVRKVTIERFQRNPQAEIPVLVLTLGVCRG